jgi:hypothetical protein
MLRGFSRCEKANREGNMRKLAIVAIAMTAMLFAGLHTWNAGATTAAGALTLGAKAYSPIVEDIACRRNSPPGKHGCTQGTHWVCSGGKCWCADCGNSGD